MATVGTRSRYEDHVRNLDTACAFFGVSRGRATNYAKLIREFFEEEARSAEHVLAHNESFEILELHELWRRNVAQFPGLKAKLARVISKGPVVREKENPAASTNRSRNDAFSFLLAGRLVAAGVRVLAVEGVVRSKAECHSDADSTCSAGTQLVDIQCKRPLSDDQLDRRAREAVSQIADSPRLAQLGIIAVDCSALMRPAYMVLGRPSEDEAYQQVHRHLLEAVAPRVQQFLIPQVCGYILYARVPAMIEETSPILSSTGRPFIGVVPFTVGTMIAVENAECVEPDIPGRILRRLERMQY